MTDVREFRITLTVDDFEAALAHYRDALGLPQLADWSSDGGQVVLLDAGRATLELFDEAQSGARRVLIAYDADATADHLIGAGAERVADPVDTPWGDRNARITSPDGMQLTLFTPSTET